MNTDYLYISDDLTGAGDLGVQLRKFEDDVYIYTSEKKSDSRNGVVIYDTETRNLDENSVKEVFKRFSDVFDQNRVIFKKIDSTLRGNIRLELEQMIQSDIDTDVFFIPAFPEMGRTTLHGKHYVDGVELSDTEFAYNTVNPVKSSYLKDFCPEMCNPFFIENFKDRSFLNIEKNSFFFCDIQNEDDMNNISKFILDHIDKSNKNIIIAASAGLAYFLKKNSGFQEKDDFTPLIPLQSVFVCGSLNSKNLDILKDKDIKKIKLNMKDLVDDRDYLKSVKDILLKELMFGKSIAVLTDNEKILRDKSDIIEQKISELFGKVYMLAPRVILSGGSTAYKCLKSTDRYFFKIENIVSTGIPLLQSDGKSFIIKPGGFGEKEFLNKVMEER